MAAIASARALISPKPGLPNNACSIALSSVRIGSSVLAGCVSARASTQVTQNSSVEIWITRPGESSANPKINVIHAGQARRSGDGQIQKDMKYFLSNRNKQAPQGAEPPCAKPVNGLARFDFEGWLIQQGAEPIDEQDSSTGRWVDNYYGEPV